MDKILYLAAIPCMIFGAMSGENLEGNKNEIANEENSQPLSLTIVELNGSEVTMSDGKSYMIHPDDTAISGGWIGNAATVDIQDTHDGSQYPLIITNKVTKNSVRAMLVEQNQVDSGSGE